jgi:hypothetical protein
MDLRLAAKNYLSLDDYTTEGTWDEAEFTRWLKEDIRPANLDLNAATREMAGLSETVAKRGPER